MTNQKVWSAPPRTPTPKATLVKIGEEHLPEGRTVVAIYAATLRDSPVSLRGIRRRGGV